MKISPDAEDHASHEPVIRRINIVRLVEAAASRKAAWGIARMIYPLDFRCEECGALLRGLRESFQIDQDEVRRRLRETAAASGRDLEQMRKVWVFSVSQMPSAEMSTVLQWHYPRAAEARRKKIEHEAATGHSVYMHGWRSALGFPGPSLDSK